MRKHQPAAAPRLDEPVLTDKLDNGYAQSKWVAAKLLRAAGERGFQVCIYQPATVAGDSGNGVWNTEDFLCRLIKGCIQQGFAPNRLSRMDMAPVNYMSRAIVALSLRPDSIGSVFHLNHPEPPSSDQLIDWFSAPGYRMNKVPDNDWSRQLQAGAETIEDFALSPLLATLSGEESDAE